MSRRKKSDVHYRSNGLPAWHMRFGPRARCGMTSFPTYRDRLVEDDFGVPCDPRYASLDIDYKNDGESSR